MSVEAVKSFITDRMPLIYVFMSGIGFSIQTLAIKVLSERGFKGSFQCVFSRGAIQFVIASCFVLWDRRSAKEGDEKVSLFGDTNYVRLIMVLRSVAGFFSIAFSFLSAEYISVGDSTVLVMMSPIIAAIASFFILGEPWYIPEFIGTILSVLGAILVAKPPFIFGSDVDTGNIDPKDFYLGVTFGLSAALFAGFAFVLVRMLGTSAKMPWPNVCLVQALGQMSLSVPSLYIAGQKSFFLPITLTEVGIIFVVGVIGAWSQIAMTLGMQREKSAAASAMRMSDVVFGFIWQVLFTADKLSLLSLCGAILVASSILVIVIFKGKSDSPSDASQSKLPSSFTSRTHEYEVVSPLEIERGDDEDDTKLPDEDADEEDESQGKRRRFGRRSKGSWFRGMLDSTTKTPLSKLISKSIRNTLYPNRKSRPSLAQSDSSRKSTKEEDDELVEIELQ
jgi:drug/metabolite transporter (DMT)-like permease